MSDVAIRVDGLSKCYRIGGPKEPYGSLRDSLMSAARGPWKALRGERKPAPTDFWALKDVSFEVKQGEVLGIIGRNGAGKSTLLKVLARITEPTTGRVEIRGRVGSLLEVGTGFHPELTGRENVYLSGAILGMSRAEISRKFDEIIAFAEVEQFVDTPVKRYSSGMYLRLAFAVAAHLEPEILIVDEVLAVGDAAFQRKCLGKLNDVATQGRTVLFVSHSMGAIQNLCSQGLVLNHGITDFQGRAQAAIEHYNRTLLTDSAVASKAQHVVYDEPPQNALQEDFAITKIEVLDSRGAPMAVVSTWSDIVLRITYWAARPEPRGSVVLQILTLEGVRLFFLSTQPDGTLPFNFSPGEGAVECVINSLPLAAGEYTVGAGLAVPMVEMLWWRSELGRLMVHANDVFGSGLAPIVSRAPVAPHHHWRLLSPTSLTDSIANVGRFGNATDQRRTLVSVGTGEGYSAHG